MEDVRAEVERLRREVEELRAGLQALRSPREASPGWADAAAEQIKEMVAKQGRATGIGIVRAVVLVKPDGQGASTGGVYGIVGLSDAADLPTDEDLTEKAAFLGNLLGLKTLREMERRHLRGQPMRLAKSELAAAVGASEAELEEALRPLVNHEWLRWVKSGKEEMYEYVPQDTSLLLLTLP